MKQLPALWSIFAEMKSTLIVNANIVNEDKVSEGDVLIAGAFIEAIGGDLSSRPADLIVDAKKEGGSYIPGSISRAQGQQTQEVVLPQAQGGAVGPSASSGTEERTGG